MKTSKLLAALSVAFTFAAHTLPAREWTDIEGRVIVADYVSADEDAVVLKMGGKEHRVPLARLSEADKTFISEQIAMPADARESTKGNDEAPAEAAPAGTVTLAGQEVKLGGTPNSIVIPLSEEALEKAKKGGYESTDVVVGIIAPAGFDPTKPQKVIVATCGTNNAAEIARGNIGAMNPFARAVSSTDWVVMAIDTPKGKPVGEYFDAISAGAFEVIRKEWPAVSGWKFATGGNSGGAKSSFYMAMNMVSMDLPLKGMYISGCNENRLESAADMYRVKRGDLRGIKMFISSGKDDKIATVASAKEVEDGVKSDGLKNTRLEVFDGGHAMHPEHIVEGYTWLFSEEE